MLTPPDSFHYSSAVGWLELGNPAEAHLELGQISPELQNYPEVLSIRWQIFAHEKKWEDALVVADAFLSQCPELIDAWIHKAYAIRRAIGGGIPHAREILLVAAERFPAEPLIQYNLACYACKLGKLDEAMNHLKVAFEIGDARALKKMAMVDDDLIAIRQKI